MKVLVAAPRNVSGFIDAGLTDEGYTVEVAPDVATAVRMMVGGGYDALVVDGGLPGLDQLVDVRPRPPAVGLVSRTNGNDGMAGTEQLLLAPFTLDQLLEALETLPRQPVDRPVSDRPLTAEGTDSTLR